MDCGESRRNDALRRASWLVELADGAPVVSYATLRRLVHRGAEIDVHDAVEVTAGWTTLPQDAVEAAPSFDVAWPEPKRWQRFGIRFRSEGGQP